MSDAKQMDTISEIEAATMRRVSWHFVPLILAAYTICYLDRVNVGFAALTANKDLGLSPVAEHRPGVPADHAH